MINIKECDIENLEKASKIAYKLNNQAEHTVTFCCKGYKEIYNDFKHIIQNDIHKLLLIYEDDNLFGVCGIFCINHIKRVDIGGPFIDFEGYTNSNSNIQTFINIGKMIIEYARKSYKGYEMNFNFSHLNLQYLELMKSVSAKLDVLEEIYNITRDKFVCNTDDESVIMYTDEFREQVMNLYDAIFPITYFTSEDLVNSAADEREIYLILKNDKVIAYGVLEWLNNSFDMPFLEMVAVDSSYRKQGYGRKLINKLLLRAFENPKVNSVSLCVDYNNENAINLYKSIGFTCKEKNYSYKLI